MKSYFTRRLETPSGFIDFYFNRIYSVEGLRYHISYMDKNKKAYVFYLVEIADRWVLLHTIKVPIWIKDLQDAFEKAVLAHTVK